MSIRRPLLAGLLSLCVSAASPVLFSAPAYAASAPEAVTGAASGVTATAVTLNGTVNPGGALLTNCQFEYGTEESYGASVPCSQTFLEIGSGTSAVAVSAPLPGLSPGTTYHYRLIAENEAGGGQGLDQTVTTPAAEPVVASEWAASVTAGSVDLRAGINPGNADTTYRFEYGTTVSYGARAPVPDGDLGSGLAEQTASAHIQGLAAETVYHYRVVAVNSAGTIHGPDHAFTTFAALTSSALPDNRAYELVSAVDKQGSDVGAFPEFFHEGMHLQQAAADGNGVVFTSLRSFGGAQSAYALSTYLASRGTGGWSVRAISPLEEPFQANLSYVAVHSPFVAFSSDLSVGVLSTIGPPLTPEAPTNAINLYSRNNATGAYRLLTSGPAAQPSGRSYYVHTSFQGASADFSHIVFTTDIGDQVYEWAGGQLSPVAVLPNGKTTVEEGLAAGIGDADEEYYAGGNVENAVSADGSRVFWTARCHSCGDEGGGDLYVRENGATTVKVSASQRTPSLGDGIARFSGATPDGSKVIFADDTAVTNEPGDNGGGVYQFDVNSGRLVDLTPDSGGSAGVLGVLGESQDGSTVYLVASGVLTSTPSGRGQVAQAGANNLYVVRNGTVTFIATLSADDGGTPWGNSLYEKGIGKIGDWSMVLGYRTARVTPDGAHVAFMSDASLTGYDNTVASGTHCGLDPHRLEHETELAGPACTEVFLYDAGSNQLSCASCNPSGERPLGNSTIPTWMDPQQKGFHPSEATSQPRYLSDDGRLFFNTYDALTPRDSNGRQDVYEYENGRQYLISSGTSSDDSTFVDATASGSDVFFVTRSQLLAQDQDENMDMYDARVGGGFPAAPVSACTGDGCREGLSVAPVLPGVASESFSGPGNPVVFASNPPVKQKAVKRKKVKHRKRKAKGRRAGKARSGGRKANSSRKGKG
jgi:hypothetical protein